MTEFNFPNLSFLVDLEFPLMRQAVLVELYCIDGPSSSQTKFRLFGDQLTKNIPARFGIHFENQSQKKEILIHHYEGDYLIKSFLSMIRRVMSMGETIWWRWWRLV